MVDQISSTLDKKVNFKIKGGQGSLPKEKLNLIFSPNLSTKKEVSEISGRGIGMDVVTKGLENLEASLTVKSNIDEGTTFIIQLTKK